VTETICWRKPKLYSLDLYRKKFVTAEERRMLCNDREGARVAGCKVQEYNEKSEEDNGKADNSLCEAVKRTEHNFLLFLPNSSV
jgi:hypothetical protein